MAVVMGCPTSDDRFASARGLLDFGFANYTSMTPPSIAPELKPVPVLKGMETEVGVTFDEPGSVVIEKGTEDALTQEITLVENVEAPVEAGQILGKVEVLVSGEMVGSYDLRAAGAVEKMTVRRAYGRLLGEVFRTKSPPAPEPPANVDTPQGEAATEATVACTCEEGACYCDEIGDVCGCTKS